MVAVRAVETEPFTAARYEALIRISNSIRAQKEPQDLFQVLVDELGKAMQFEAIAQFDESANKLYWHFSPDCTKIEGCPVEADTGETLPRYVYRVQETVVLGALHAETRFPAFTRKMRETGFQSLC